VRLSILGYYPIAVTVHARPRVGEAPCAAFGWIRPRRILLGCWVKRGSGRSRGAAPRTARAATSAMAAAGRGTSAGPAYW